MSEPREPSFAEALEIAAQWIGLWEAGELSDEVLADRVGELVASRDGARGFFVVALAGDAPLMDRLNEPLVQQLRQAGAGVVDLMVRNLAMSSAMVVAHGRKGDSDQQAASERVRSRSTELLRLLDAQAVGQRLQTLLAAVEPGEAAQVSQSVADDRAFLDRWGYDDGQRKAIRQALTGVAES